MRTLTLMALAAVAFAQHQQVYPFIPKETTWEAEYFTYTLETEQLHYHHDHMLTFRAS